MSSLGYKHTEDVKRKIGLIHRGKIVSKETRLKLSQARLGKTYPNLSGAYNGMFGKQHSIETRNKMAFSHTGKKRPEISGLHSSSKRPEVRRKLAESHLGVKNSMWGKQRLDMMGDANPMCTTEQRQRARELRLGKGLQTYNPKACRVIDNFSLQYGYTFQHALNGGEIRMFGYSVDGYDKEKNVVIEYYEPQGHNRKASVERDNKRMHFLIEKLHCLFIVLRERYDNSISIEVYGNVTGEFQNANYFTMA